MSQWAKEILAEAPAEESRVDLVDRTLQIEADRCAEILEGCADRHSNVILCAVLTGLCRVLRGHLGRKTKIQG